VLNCSKRKKWYTFDTFRFTSSELKNTGSITIESSSYSDTKLATPTRLIQSSLKWKEDTVEQHQGIFELSLSDA
jgi:hypothetical protein